MSANNLPPDLLAKATGAITSYTLSEEGRDADAYFNEGDIARVVLIAADVPRLIAERDEARRDLALEKELYRRLSRSITAKCDIHGSYSQGCSECRLAQIAGERDELRAALAAVVADYASLLQSDYQTRNNPDPAADEDSIREARRLLEGKEIR